MSDKEKRGQEWLQKLLQLAQVDAEVISQQSEECCWLIINEQNLTPEQIEILIGTNGLALDAMQYLVNTILNIGRESEEHTSYMVELNGYRVRRQQELRSMADYAAIQVRRTGLEFELTSLSSAERRQVHTLLEECEDLETYSRGQEPDRRLVVRLK